MMKRRKELMGVMGLVAVSALGLSACSTGDSSADSSADGPVEIEYMAWAPGLEEAVDTWNAENPDIQVNFTRMAGGGDTIVKISSSVEAGNAPCLSQVNFDAVASQASAGYLMDVSDYTKDVEGEFIPWTWSQVALGDAVYGIPQDTGPVVTYYRSDIYDSLGLKPATTWEEYASNAAAIHAADPSMYGAFLGTNDPTMLATYAAQNGAEWSAIDGDEWKIDIDGEESTQVADFWQKMIDAGDVLQSPRYDPSFFKLLADSTLVNYVGASWNSGLIEANVEGQAGLWKVAQMPKWGSSTESANNGGGMVAVLEGCEYPEQSIKFATWLNTSEEAWETLAGVTGLYPAAEAALDYDSVQKNSDYFGGEPLADAFAESAQNVGDKWIWGPASVDTNTAIGDGLALVSSGTGTLSETLTSAQDETLSVMESKGIAATAAN